MKNRVTKPGLVAMSRKVCCKFCNEAKTIGNIKKHEETCYLNPDVRQDCACCGKPIKNYRTSKGTCSRSCANTHFKSGEGNGNWKGTNYQTICFTAHGKKCVICNEENIVAAHHVNHDHNDNRPENLVPLCPTHHQYVHSRFSKLVLPQINNYLQRYLGLA